MLTRKDLELVPGSGRLVVTPPPAQAAVGWMM